MNVISLGRSQLARVVTPVIVACAALPLAAQTAESPSSHEGVINVIQLDAFVVDSSKDVGYAASSTLAGSRLNSNLKDLAAPISVFTKEFLDDLGVTTVNDALEYAVNTVTDYDPTGNGIVGENFQTRIRGIAGAGRARNYMSTGLNVDTYNTERLDFSRGPNSVLFGVGSPAGIINSTTKSAKLGRDFGSVQLKLGSFEQKRASLDFNKSLTEKLALRLNLLGQRKDGYRDFEFQDKEGAAIAGTWRPFEKTRIRFEVETMDITENRARPWTPFDGYLGWEAAGSPGAHTATTWGTAPTGTANAAGGTILFMSDGVWADQFVWNTGNTAFKWSNGGTPTVPGLNTPPNILDFSVVPRTANPLGAGARSNSDSKVGGLFIEQQIGRNLFLEFAASNEDEKRNVVAPMNFGVYRVRKDANAFLPTFNADGVQTGMVANPNFGETVAISNGGFGQDSHVWNHFFREEYRATAAYNLDFRELIDGNDQLARILGHHRLAALYSTSGYENTARRARWVNADPTRSNPDYGNNNNRIFWGNHYDPFAENEVDRGMQDPFASLAAAGRQAVANQPGVFVTPSLENRLFDWNRTETTTAMFATQSYFWDDRIVGLFGWRTDEQDLYNSTRTVEAVTNAVTGFTRNPLLRTVSGNTFTRGVVAHIFPNKLSLYYNRANNFQDNDVAEVIGPVGNLTSIGNRKGEGEDAGVKFWLFDGKIGASLGWYSTADSNQNISIDGNFLNWSEAIWNATGPTVDMGGKDTRSLESTGYEFELTANPTKNITLTFNLKNSETVTSKLYPWGVKYLADNRATWLTHANTEVFATGIPAGTTVGQLVTQLDELMGVLIAPEGRSPFQDRETTANFYGRYTFDNQSALKGFAFGAGLQYRGESLIAYRTQTDNLPVYAPDYYMGSAMLAYSRKINAKMGLRLQLNIDNLFDLQDPQPIQGAEPTGSQYDTFDSLGLLYDDVVYTVYLPTPRSYSLTATLTF